MAHFAELDDNNIVTRVIVVDNEYEADGENWCASTFGGRWKQTSWNNRIRKNYAGPGFTYDETRDAFIPPKPYASWTFNEETCTWSPPNPQPNDGYYYRWSEAIRGWFPTNKKLFTTYGADKDYELIRPTVEKYGLEDGKLVTIIEKIEYTLQLEKANNILFVHVSIPEWKPSVKQLYQADIDILHREIGTDVYAYHSRCNLELGDTKTQLTKFAELFGFYEYENAVLGNGFEHVILRKEAPVG